MAAIDFKAQAHDPAMVPPRFDLFGHLLATYGPVTRPNQAGEVLHMHPSHVRALCQSGELPGVKIGNRWVIPTVKLAEILEGSSHEA